MTRESIRVVWLAVLAMGLLTVPTLALAGGEANLLVGQKNLDLDVDPAVDEVEDQTALGVLLTFTRDWPVSIAVDIIRSEDDTTGSYTYSYYGYTYDIDGRLEFEALELDVGVRKYWGEKLVQGYVGGGVAIVDAEATVEGTLTFPGFPPVSFSESESDTGVGYWVNAGVAFRINPKFHVGVDARLSDAEVTFGDEDVDAGGTTLGAYVGFRWGE